MADDSALKIGALVAGGAGFFGAGLALGVAPRAPQSTHVRSGADHG